MSLTTQDLANIRNVVVDAINKSFEALSAPRFDALEVRMDRLEARVASLESHVSTLKRRVGAIEDRLARIEADIETLKNDVETLYHLASNPTLTILDKDFKKLNNKEKLRLLRSYLYKIAEQTHVKL